VSAAFTAPAGLSIITTSFAEGQARNRALLIYTATAAIGFSTGLVFSGLLTELGWRWTLLMPVPLALITLAGAIPLVPDSGRQARASQSFDLAGAVTLSATMLLLVFTVVEAPRAGWASARTLGSLAGVAALLAAFVTLELRSSSPLVRLGILRSASLVRANLGALALVGSWVGFQFIAVLYMQQLRGWSSLETGLAIFPGGALVALLAPTLTPRLVMRFGVAPVIFAGATLTIAAYVLFLPIDLGSGYLATMLPTFLVAGVGFGLAYGPLNIAATNGIAPEEQGLAGGLVNTSFQFGGALVLAVVTAVNDANVGADGSPQAVLDGFRAALFVPVIVAVLGALAAATGLIPVRRRVAESAPEHVHVPRVRRALVVGAEPQPVALTSTVRGPVLWSSDVNNLLPFYRDLLRLPVARQTPEFVVLGDGDGHSLSLGTRAELDQRAADPHRFSLGLDSEDLHSDLHRLLAAGVDVLEPPVELEGLRYATLIDPEGNMVRLFQR
jgi:MFS family permease